MSDELVLDVTKEDGTVEQKRVRCDAIGLSVRFAFFFFVVVVVVASRVAR